MKRILTIFAILFTYSTYAAPELDQYEFSGWLGGKSFEEGYTNNVSIMGFYQFNKDVFLEASEFELYIALGETEDDGDFTLIDTKALSDFDPADVRLVYAFQRAYLSLNDLNLDNIDEFLSTKKLSVYAIIKNSAGEEFRTEYRTIDLSTSCCWFEEDQLEVPDFTSQEAVNFSVNATHVDQDQTLRYAIVESENLEFPEGIEINENTGEIIWENPEIGEFGFTIKAIDNNNWYYDAQLSFKVNGVQSVNANDLNLKIFPNPTLDFVNIELQNSEQRDVQVYDSNGNLIQVDESTGNVVKVNLLNKSSGVYYIKINEVVYPVIKN